MTDIPKSPIDIIALHEDGQRSLNDDHAKESAKKLGVLRGGNSGCLSESGQIYGTCHRRSYLRSVGVETPIEPHSYLMFGAGIANESLWTERLLKSWQGIIKCEEEIPIAWETSNGTKVTGRPDIVLCEQDGKPVLGLELKLASSSFSAYRYAAKGEPKIDHLVQAAHYSWKLDVPFKLVYTSRSNYPLGFGGMRTVWLKAVRWLTRGEFMAIPFIIEYDMMVKDDTVYYQGPLQKEMQKTPITLSGIERYYETVSEMGKGKGLGPRPADVKADGSVGKGKGGECEYCSFAPVCDQFEHGEFQRWEDECRVLAEEIKE